MRCAKNPTLPQHRSTMATATALPTSGEVFVLPGQSCLCWGSVDTAPASAGECQRWAVPTELAQSCWVLNLGLSGYWFEKGAGSGALCSGVLLPLHQRINNSHDFAATWQFAHDWEGLQSNSVTVKHPSFWAIA